MRKKQKQKIRNTRTDFVCSDKTNSESIWNDLAHKNPATDIAVGLPIQQTPHRRIHHASIRHVRAQWQSGHGEYKLPTIEKCHTYCSYSNRMDTRLLPSRTKIFNRERKQQQQS